MSKPHAHDQQLLEERETSRLSPDACDAFDKQMLLFHRIAIRRLKRNPDLLERTLAFLPRIREHGWGDQEIGGWRALLSLPTEAFCRQLTSRSSTMTTLRMASPMRYMPEFDLQDPDHRRRIHLASRRMARRVPLYRSPRSSASSSGEA